jgi:hypothetical protein
MVGARAIISLNQPRVVERLTPGADGSVAALLPPRVGIWIGAEGGVRVGWVTPGRSVRSAIYNQLVL